MRMYVLGAGYTASQIQIPNHDKPPENHYDKLITVLMVVVHQWSKEPLQPRLAKYMQVIQKYMQFRME